VRGSGSSAAPAGWRGRGCGTVVPLPLLEAGRHLGFELLGEELRVVLAELLVVAGQDQDLLLAPRRGLDPRLERGDALVDLREAGRQGLPLDRRLTPALRECGRAGSAGAGNRVCARCPASSSSMCVASALTSGWASV